MAFIGKLIIFSAPSGSGKTTIVRHLLETNAQLGFSISATTRSPRQGEVSGQDYYFLSVNQFEKKIKNGEFLEWEEVYPGRFYGTLEHEIERLWSLHKHVLFDVDVLGGLNLKERFGKRALSVYVKAPSYEVIEQRLRSRGTESEESLIRRLDKVKEEMRYESYFDKVLINNELQEALAQASQLVADFILINP
jgi:guanylate kinase